MIDPLPGIPNLMRFYRRRLGLTQTELAYLLGYENPSWVSRVENGLRTPHLSEVLLIELVFGVPGVMVFPQIREVVGARVRRRLQRLLSDQRRLDSTHPRLSYKSVQLERVLASFRTRDESDLSEPEFWPTKSQPQPD